MSITIINNILKNNDCYKADRQIIPKGIMVHSTATPGAMAKNFLSSWNHSKVYACTHAFIDDTGIYQTLPWNWRGWHAGSGKIGSANNTHISFEICEPGTFKYINNKMSGYDVKENEEYFNNVYNKAVELCAYLCKKYNLTEKDIICHSEGYIQGIASNHADVMHWFPKHGKNMDIFRSDVRKKMTQQMFENIKTTTYVVNASSLNVRRGPSTSYSVAYGLKRGQKIEVVSINNGWAKLKDNNYVASRYLILDKTNNNPSSWTETSWNKAVKKGLFNNDPKKLVTREELAEILSKLKLI